MIFSYLKLGLNDSPLIKTGIILPGIKGKNQKKNLFTK